MKKRYSVKTQKCDGINYKNGSIATAVFDDTQIFNYSNILPNCFTNASATTVPPSPFG